MPRILFLAAEPTDKDRRRLGDEIRAIEKRLRLAEFRELFEIEQKWGLRTTDLQDHLLRHKPEIVHFSCPGSRSGQISVENRSGRSQSVRINALAELFSIIGDNVCCVILNADHSAQQAAAIGRHVHCVIGMLSVIPEDSAVSFFASFYQALGYGKCIREAFSLGVNQVRLAGLKGAAVPILLTRNETSGGITFAQTRTLTASELSILERMGTGGPVHRSETARQLGLLREPVAIPIFERRWLLEPDGTVRYWLAIAVGFIGGNDANRALLRLRQNETDAFGLLGIDEALGVIQTGKADAWGSS